MALTPHRTPRPRPVIGPTIDQLIRRIRPKWMRDALCREHPEVDFFPDIGQPSAPARAICQRCTVRPECLEHALADRSLAGIWGDTTPAERREIRRTRQETH